MKVLVIVAHPDLDNSRVNKRLVEELKKYSEVKIHNLSEEYPDEKIDLEKEKKLLLEYDRIVFQYPIYWYNTPYFLKKWLEVVLERGWAYGPDGVALKGKEFLVAISIGAPEISYQGGGYNHFSISEMLKPMEQTANLINMIFLPPFKIYSSVVINDDELNLLAEEYPKYILNPETNPAVALERLRRS